jgi:hypothetical protein
MRTSKTLSRDRVDSPEVGARIQKALALVPSVVGQMCGRRTVHANGDDMTSFGNEGRSSRGAPTIPVAARRSSTGPGSRSARRSSTVSARRAVSRADSTRSSAVEAANWAYEGTTLRSPAPPPPGSAGAAEARIGDRLAAMATAYAAGMLLVSDDGILGSLRDARGTPEDELAREELKARIAGRRVGDPCPLRRGRRGSRRSAIPSGA